MEPAGSNGVVFSRVYTRGMPWMETNAMAQRLSFLINYESGQWSMSELCERFGITRPTGYEPGRSLRGGSEGRKAPNGCPHETPERWFGF